METIEWFLVFGVGEKYMAAIWKEYICVYRIGGSILNKAQKEEATITVYVWYQAPS